MVTPYLGEIRMFSGHYAPVEWALCDGSLLSIADNSTLFNLIGTTYGGDGQTNFAVPNLQSRVPVHMGKLTGPSGGGTYELGQTGGVENVTLTVQELPAHTHPLHGAASGQQLSPKGASVLAKVTSNQAGAMTYGPGPGQTTLAPASIGSNGDNLAHINMQPSFAVTFIIALSGIFPSPG